MEYETMASGGAGALVVWGILKIVGRWAARMRWHTVTSTESVEHMAAERDEAIRAKEEAERRAELRIHDLELRLAATEAVAISCRAHLDRTLGIEKEEA